MVLKSVKLTVDEELGVVIAEQEVVREGLLWGWEEGRPASWKQVSGEQLEGEVGMTRENCVIDPSWVWG